MSVQHKETMLIYQNAYKNVSVDDRYNSSTQELGQPTSQISNRSDTNQKKQLAQLTRANTNFLRNLGFKVRQYKKLKK